MEIFNTSLVCRKDGVDVYESGEMKVCVLAGVVCVVSIPDMKMADELID